MDKVEYQERLEELTTAVQKKDYDRALSIVEGIDWKRVKSIRTLSMVADVYEAKKDYSNEKRILQIAQSRASIGRSILARLVETCLKLGEVDEAERYFKEFSHTAQNDNSRYVLQYKIYKAKRAPLEAQIRVLEEYREREYTEQWAYELAQLYHRAGEREKCVDACDDLILWFSEGQYVMKAMELKKTYQPLTTSQEAAYEREKASLRRGNQLAATAAAVSAMNGGAFTAAAAENLITPTAPGAALDPEQRSMDLQNLLSRNLQDALGKVASTTEIDDEKEEAAPAETAEEPEIVVERAVMPEEKPQEPKKTFSADDEDFDLDAFLKETAGSFSEEIGSGDFGRRTIDTDALPDINDVLLADVPTEDTAVIPDIPGVTEAAAEAPAEAAVTEETEAPAEEPEIAAEAEMPAEEKGPEIVVERAVMPEIEEPAVEEPAVEEPVALEEPVIEEPVIEESVIEEPVIEEPAAAAEEPAIEAELPADEEVLPEAEETAWGTPVVEEPVAEEPVAEEPVAEEPVIVEPVIVAPIIAAAAAEEPAAKKPLYNEELEIPDPEPTEEERKSRTIPLNKIGQNTVPLPLDQILKEETPEERRIRILNKARPSRMNETQRKIFTYFARVPGMDAQILEGISGVYEHAGERTSSRGNLAVIGAKGSGKSRLTQGLIVAMCDDLGLQAAKVARITAEDLNQRDPAKVVSEMAGGFLVIEEASKMSNATVDSLTQAMDFRTDCMVLILEDEKAPLREFLKNHPNLDGKIEKTISIPVFTNDELVTFARTYATENGCKLDDMAVLALYTMIGNSQSEDEPVSISQVRDIIDAAINNATRGRRKPRRPAPGKREKWTILHEKDFDKI